MTDTPKRWGAVIHYPDGSTFECPPAPPDFDFGAALARMNQGILNRAALMGGPISPSLNVNREPSL
jgi:hypothetical protein